MQFSNVRPVKRPPLSPLQPTSIMHFDLRIADVTLRDLSLVRSPNGSLLIWGPKADGRPVVQFGSRVRFDIADAAIEEFLALGGNPALVSRATA